MDFFAEEENAFGNVVAGALPAVLLARLDVSLLLSSSDDALYVNEYMRFEEQIIPRNSYLLLVFSISECRWIASIHSQLCMHKFRILPLQSPLWQRPLFWLINHSPTTGIP
jgi:hypothetical protein